MYTFCDTSHKSNMNGLNVKQDKAFMDWDAIQTSLATLQHACQYSVRDGNCRYSIKSWIRRMTIPTVSEKPSRDGTPIMGMWQKYQRRIPKQVVGSDGSDFVEIV